jgi:antitoxin PrlF
MSGTRHHRPVGDQQVGTAFRDVSWTNPNRSVRLADSVTVGKEYSVAVVIMRAKGQMTIPQDVREAAHLEEGDPVEIEITADGILLRPKKLIDASQAWFWTPEWQQGERAASADIEAGRLTTHASSEAFLDSLDS